MFVNPIDGQAQFFNEEMHLWYVIMYIRHLHVLYINANLLYKFEVWQYHINLLFIHNI